MTTARVRRLTGLGLSVILASGGQGPGVRSSAQTAAPSAAQAWIAESNRHAQGLLEVFAR